MIPTHYINLTLQILNHLSGKLGTGCAPDFGIGWISGYRWNMYLEYRMEMKGNKWKWIYPIKN